MASPHHVHVDPSSSVPKGTAMYGDHQHEPLSYNQNFPIDQESAFNASWAAVDPSLPQGTPYNQPSFSQDWSGHAAAPAQGASYSLSRDYYNSHFFGPPAQYQAHASPQFSQPFNTGNAFIQPQPPNHVGQSLPPFSTSTSSNTIAPSALQSQSSVAARPATTPLSGTSLPPGPMQTIQLAPKDQGPDMAPIARIEPPKGAQVGKFLVIDFDELSSVTKSRKLAPFANISEIPQDLPITKSTIPTYVQRKSRNELRRLAVTDPKIAAKIAKSAPKQSKILVPKAVRTKSLSAVSAASPQSRASVESSSESESSDGYSDYESSDSEEEEAEPSPLPSSKPQQPLEGVRYDAIKAVWRPRNRYPAPDQIRTGLKDFWELIQTIRDRWKVDNNAVKQATDAKRDSELPMLKARVKSQRDTLEVALRAALEHGHPDIIRLFGESKALVFALYQFMRECIGENDYNGTFVQVTLQLLSRCTTLSSEVLEATNLSKILARLIKRGNPSVQALAQKIVDAATKKSKSEPTKTSKPTTDGKVSDGKVKQDGQAKPILAKVAGVKHSLGSDAQTGQAAKRVVSSSPSSAVKGGVLKKSATSGADKASSSGTSGQTKIKAQAVKKPPTTNMFANLPSAKKPIVANAAAKSKAVATEKKVAPAAAASSGFSFAETMESFSKPKKSEVVPKQEEKLPPETDEERAKRLRKEERRKLRVMFKPEHLLTEIRVFDHDPEEEFGHDANMVRDVADLNSEGLMFKQHKDMMDIDDEDDEPMERTYFDFRKPTEIDFSHIDQKTREDHFEPYGGGKLKAESPEKAIQDRHVANAMMVHYFTRSDIPTSPHEPSDPYTGEKLETKIGEPPQPDTVYSSRAKAPAPAADVSAILAGLGALAPASNAPPAPAPTVSAPHQQGSGGDSYSAIQNILAQYSQPTQQPMQQQQVAAQAATQHLQPSQSAQPAQPDLQSLLTSLQSHGQQQLAANTPPQASWPQQWPTSWPTAFTTGTGVAAAPPNPDPNAFLAMLGLASGTMPRFPGYGQQQHQAANLYAPPQQPQGDQHDNDSVAGRAKKWRKPQSNQYKNDDDKPKFIYPCRFFKEGKCRKGNDCTYRHDI